MTEQEARNLKVGDMIIFYDCESKYLIKGHTTYYEVVEGEEIPADLGLVVNTAPSGIAIDWFADEDEGAWCGFLGLGNVPGVTRIEKV
jgi:hypothetical protein